jgi:hypothetical protein
MSTSAAPVPVDEAVKIEPPASLRADDLEVARLMTRAKLMLELGDVGAARGVLESAVEAGSPLAMFKLAESYDPTVLQAWGTVGTKGDAAKAQKLYARAAAFGVEAAKDRLKSLP